MVPKNVYRWQRSNNWETKLDSKIVQRRENCCCDTNFDEGNQKLIKKSNTLWRLRCHLYTFFWNSLRFLTARNCVMMIPFWIGGFTHRTCLPLSMNIYCIIRFSIKTNRERTFSTCVKQYNNIANFDLAIVTRVYSDARSSDIPPVIDTARFMYTVNQERTYIFFFILLQYCACREIYIDICNCNYIALTTCGDTKYRTLLTCTCRKQNSSESNRGQFFLF